VRDAVVRGANAGLPLDRIVSAAALPPHLASRRALLELYGRVDWSARAIYGNELGWFDGQADALFPLGDAERAELFVDAMGGPDAVRQRAASAEPRAAATLLALLEDHPATTPGSLDADLAAAYDAIAAVEPNSNGRGYLLHAAAERRGTAKPRGEANPGEGFVGDLPLDLLFGTLATRLKPEAAADVHESVRFDLGADGRWTVTQRRGVAEVVAGDPLPGTPAPVATVRTDGDTWRRMSLKLVGPAAAVASGDLQVDGFPAFAAFMNRFDRALLKEPDALP
jgi:alkyl sulfatase BDS1-like metallo-beta-lactamase superfamily hydrolase